VDTFDGVRLGLGHDYRSVVPKLDGRLVEAEVRWDEVEDPSQYPFTIPSIRSMRRISLDQSVTFLVGENGSGKSTLIEAIAVGAGLNAEGGSRNLRFSTRPSHSSLHEHLTLSWRGRPRRAFFLRAESFYNVASAYEQLFPTSLHEQSHGESFIEAMQRHFWERGLYLLDEPESALSLRGQLALLRHMHERLSEHCQFIISTHSPILLAFPGARIYAMTDEGPHPLDYHETDQYQMTRAFLDDPDQFFRHLFLDDG
jgi:predicted ATPase